MAVLPADVILKSVPELPVLYVKGPYIGEPPAVTLVTPPGMFRVTFPDALTDKYRSVIAAGVVDEVIPKVRLLVLVDAPLTVSPPLAVVPLLNIEPLLTVIPLLKVFNPANVCSVVLAKPLTVGEALRKFQVAVLAEEEILKSVPEFPMLCVKAGPVRVLPPMVTPEIPLSR